MLIDFSKKKRLVTYKEKQKHKKEIRKKIADKSVRMEEIDSLLIKSSELLEEERSIFYDIPLVDAEKAVVIDPCTKRHRSTVSLYDQYIR